MKTFSLKNDIKPLHMFMRMFFFILVIVTAFTGPWWISFGLTSILIVFFNFYEVILGGLILDLLFSSESLFLPVGNYVFTSTLLLLITISWILKYRIRGIGKI